MNLKRVYRAIIAVGMAVVVVRLAQMARDLAIAKYFGVSAESDAYFLAVLIPMHLINVVAGSINIALVPRMIKTEEESGEKAAHHLIENSAAMTLALLIAFGLVAGLSFPFFASRLADHVTDASADLARNLLWAMIPMLILSGMATVWSGILTAKERFALPSIVPVITPLLILALLQVWPAETRIYALAAGTSLGALLEVFVIGIALKRRGYRLFPRWHGWSDSVRELGKDLGPLAGGAALLTLVSLLPQFIATGLQPGSVSVLSYSTKVSTVLASIAGVAVATVTQTYFSKLVAQGRWGELRSSLNRITLLSLALLGLLTVLAIAGSEILTRLLFQRGEFTVLDTKRVSPVQALYAIQIPWAALSLMFYRLAAALGARKVLWMVPTGGVLTLAILAPILAGRWGVGGLALDVSIFHIVSTSAYWWILSQNVIPRESRNEAMPELEIQPGHV